MESLFTRKTKESNECLLCNAGLIILNSKSNLHNLWIVCGVWQLFQQFIVSNRIIEMTKKVKFCNRLTNLIYTYLIIL